MENVEKSTKLGAKKETVVNVKETVVTPGKGKKERGLIYSLDVINVNRELKTVRKSIGGCREALLVHCTTLHPKFRSYLNASKKDVAIFEEIKAGLRPCKNNKTGEITGYSPFYLLQFLYAKFK